MRTLPLFAVELFQSLRFSAKNPASSLPRRQAGAVKIFNAKHAKKAQSTQIKNDCPPCDGGRLF